MDLPLFSQVPAAILRKLEPHQKKRVKFCDDYEEQDENNELLVKEVEQPDIFKENEQPDILKENEQPDILKENLEEVTSSDYPDILSSKSVTPIQQRPTSLFRRASYYADDQIKQQQQQPEIKPIEKNKVEIADAIVQVDLVKPELVSQSTQTYPQDFEDQEELKPESSGYKPMYSIPKKEGGSNQPPLKIGLSLPKGKKRKVYYPDDDDDDDNKDKEEN